MAFTPLPPFPKSRGDNIRSTDWNDAITEIQRLDTDKVDRAGDAINGSLTIAGALGVGTREPPKVPLAITSDGADEAPIMGLGTPNNEDFLSLFGGRRSNQLPFIAWKRGDLRFGAATSLAGGGFKEFLRINSADNAAARVEIDGRIRAGSLVVGPWPANATRYIFFGTNTLDQTQAGNYALLQDVGGATPGITFLNSPRSIQIRINNQDKLVVQNDGNIDVVAPTALRFGESTRQMINLWRGLYGIGVQNSTFYCRSDVQFAWHQDGIHHDDPDDPGASFNNGGRTLMLLDGNGNLHIRGALVQNNSQNRLKARLPIIFPGGGGGGVIERGGGILNAPDERLEANIQPLTGALDRLLQLRGVTFHGREPEQQGNVTGAQMGMIAQEVEEVFPEWISVDFEGNKQVGFRGFEALTVEAFREVKNELVRLQTENRELAERVANLEKSQAAPKASRAKK